MELWLVAGALKVKGTHGVAEMSVPVPSYARQMLPMRGRWVLCCWRLVTGLAIGANLDSPAPRHVTRNCRRGRRRLKRGGADGARCWLPR